MSVGQASEVQASMPQGSKKVLEMERNLDLRVIFLPKGSVHMKTKEDYALLGMIKDIGVNIAILPLQTLHELHQGVSSDLGIREECTLVVINNVNIKN